MARVYGMKFAVITMLGDMLKCVIAMLLSKWLKGDVGLMVSGIACITGHCFPVFYNFKGGKGVSVGGALGFIVDWRVGLAVLLFFLIGAFVTHKVSVGSCCGCAAGLITAFMIGLPHCLIVLVVYAACLIVFKHTDNLTRVLNGTEPDFRAAKDTTDKLR